MHPFKRMFQGPPGLSFGPNLPSPKFKEVKAKQKKVKSRAAAEKERKNTRKERQREREDKLRRRAKRREEENQCKAKPEVTKAKKCTRKSNHGTEQVDIIILKLLRKSQKSRKEVSKSRANKAESPEAARPNWRHGMREERHEVRNFKANLEKKRSGNLEPSQVSPSVDNLDKTNPLEEKPTVADIHQTVPIVDVVGPDCAAHEVHSSSGGGAVQLGWPHEPDHAVPSSGAQSPIDPEAFCLKFFQVRRKQFCIINSKTFGVLSPSYCSKYTNVSVSMNLPLFRCPLTTSALPKLTRATGKPLLKSLSLLLPSHPVKQQYSLLARSPLLKRQQSLRPHYLPNPYLPLRRSA